MRSGPGGCGEKPIDVDVLSRHAGADATLQCEVLVLFVEQARLVGTVLAGAGRDLALREAAHRIKGAAQAIGAVAVERHATTLEHLLSTQPGQGPAARMAAADLRTSLAAASAFAEQVIVDLRPVGLAKTN